MNVKTTLILIYVILILTFRFVEELLVTCASVICLLTRECVLKC